VVDVTDSQKDDVLILAVDGRLDAASSPLLERKVNTFIDAGQHKLLFNFENVTYLSSAGMRLLLAVSKKLAAVGGRMVVATVHDEVMEVMKMAGFDQLLEIAHTETEALSAFQA
jgi:anti-anti-sigma factor